MFIPALVLVIVPFGFSLIQSENIIERAVQAVTYWTTLAASVLCYRVSPFHPLYQYPGPVICKLSRLWTVYKNWDGHLPQYHKALHDRYGPIVRIGMPASFLASLYLSYQLQALTNCRWWTKTF